MQKIPFSFAGVEADHKPHVDEFFARLGAGVEGQDQLFYRLYVLLQFPDYFGFNWNALYECLTDFHWIKNKAIVLCHDELPKLTQNDLKIYLTILLGAVTDWEGNSERSFKVAFPRHEKTRIIELLS